MNASMKAALKNPQSRCFQLRSAFFHSTPFLDRGRRNPSNSRFNNNNFGSFRRNRFKGHRLNDAGSYVNYLFQSWESDFMRDEEPSNKGPSWFHRSNQRSRRNGQGHQYKGTRGFGFCEDIDDDETVFRSAFRGRFFEDRFFVWSDEDDPNCKRSSRRSKRHKSSWRWGNQNEDRYHHYTPEEDTRKSKLASERTALGLSASGPLKLEDVKTAYRASALKWHPDRHQGSSKAKAEEKFKHCTSAYQTLCDSLAVN